MLKKSNRYLILHKVIAKSTSASPLGNRPTIETGNPQFTRREVTGEEALAFLRELTNAEGYEIYELKGSPLILQTTVVVAREEEVIAEEIGKANSEVEDAKE